MTAVNGDVAVVGGAPGATYGAATLSYYQTTPAVNSIQATIGDGAQVSASPAGTFNGDALDIVATTFDALGNPSIPVAVTFTAQLRRRRARRLRSRRPDQHHPPHDDG